MLWGHPGCPFPGSSSLGRHWWRAVVLSVMGITMEMAGAGGLELGPHILSQEFSFLLPDGLPEAQNGAGCHTLPPDLILGARPVATRAFLAFLCAGSGSLEGSSRGRGGPRVDTMGARDLPGRSFSSSLKVAGGPGWTQLQQRSLFCTPTPARSPCAVAAGLPCVLNSALALGPDHPPSTKLSSL